MPTTIKAALKKWEEATGRKAGEAREIKLIGVYPPIEKMEGPFHLLINCEKFSLSTNCITNIANLQAFKNLKILSLGRNVIKNLPVLMLNVGFAHLNRLRPRAEAKLLVFNAEEEESEQLFFPLSPWH